MADKVEKAEKPQLAKHDASVLDLVFAMDCTGSMASYIQAATEVNRFFYSQAFILCVLIYSYCFMLFF